MLKDLDHLCENLVVPIENKRILHQIVERIGSLGKPSKMPGHSWSIPAKYCHVGSKLHNVEGTTCSLCYARRGRYAFPKVQRAMEKRLQSWREDPDWVQLMAIRLLWLKEDYFRWFDSGDLQSSGMLKDINHVALLTPQIKHWLPTQERAVVYSVGDLATNLNVRFSGTLIDREPSRGKLTADYSSSSVTRDRDKATCPSINTNGRCEDCRSCWDKSIKHITYLVH